MKICSLFVSSALAVSAMVSSTFAADTFKLDPVHSMLVYKINHVGVSNSLGRFNDPEGMFTLDKDDPTKCTFELNVAVEKVDTANPKRDQHLKSPDFFNANQFPIITFKSTAVKKTGDTTIEITGNLNLHGVEKPITFTLNKVGEADMTQMHMGYRAGFDGTIMIKRSDFGMTGMQGLIGEDVTLMVNLEGVKQ